MRGRRIWNEERALFVAGALGLAAAIVVACGDDDDDGSSSPDAGDASGGSGGSSGRGGSGGGGSGGSSSGRGGSGGGGSGGSSSQPSADCEQSGSTASNTAAVVDAANALLDALTADQKTKATYDNTLATAQVWSNFPTTFVTRNGVKIGDMSDSAQEKAVALVGVAAGDTGAKLFEELRAADEWLHTDGKASATDYGRGLYYFSIHGTPSTNEPWMLQIGGHHLAYNFVYGSKCTSGTPLFDGAEPMDWTDSGTKHSPLEAQRSAMVALLASVGSMSDAKLSGTFGDLVNGPSGGMMGGGMMGSGSASGGGGDTKYPSSLTYPTSGRGAAVSGFTSEQKALVKTAIEAWVKNVASPVADALLEIYESDDALSQTYVGYSGSTDLSTQASYVRIDGPRVWIEVTIQGGIVYRDVVHYHTIWRDKAADYGAEFASE